MKQYTLPSDYDTCGYGLVLIRSAMLPIVIDLLHAGHNPARWATDEQQAGRDAIREIEGSMTQASALTFLATIEDLRRAVINGFDGTVFPPYTDVEGVLRPGYADSRVYRQQLDDIKAAIEAGASGEDLLAKLDLILAALA